MALLSDWTDATSESVEGDEEIHRAAAEGIAGLNRRHGLAPAGDRFLLLHRRRVWNESQQRWIGWERKRGKLHELNRLLRGASDTTFLSSDDHPLRLPQKVRYVITVDADTMLPRDTVKRLIGKMAHPLNQPRLDTATNRVVEGHAVLQPRVTAALPMDDEGSVYQRAFASLGGIDPYAAAMSDVYQDLFEEGSYTGKGIYAVDAFETALAGRTPNSTLLSHDLFEGVFARAGLASDVEVVEAYPARYDVAALRSHRWARGDWQLLPWILGWNALLGKVRKRSAMMPASGRWKMVDNLRRTSSPITCLLAFVAGWILPFDAALIWNFFVLGTIAVPSFAPVLSAAIVPRHASLSLPHHIRSIMVDFRIAFLQSMLVVAFLAHQAWLMSDAIIRTLVRLLSLGMLFLNGRPLAKPASAGNRAGSPTIDGWPERSLSAWQRRWRLGSPETRPGSSPSHLAFCGLFLRLSHVGSAFHPQRSQNAYPPQKTSRLCDALAELGGFSKPLLRRKITCFRRTISRKTHRPSVAHRTSPTNLGLYLLSTASAHDFGWLGIIDTIERLEATCPRWALSPVFAVISIIGTIQLTCVRSIRNTFRQWTAATWRGIHRARQRLR